MFTATLVVTAALMPSTAGDAALATMLRGRVARLGVACINSRFVRRSRVIPGTAIIYEMSDNRWYVQRPQQNADLLTGSDILISRSPLGALCRTDIVDFEDRSSRMRTGFATLGEFIPYDRLR